MLKSASFCFLLFGILSFSALLVRGSDRQTFLALYKDNEFEIVKGLVKGDAAWATFSDRGLFDGWGYLHVETNLNQWDEITAYAAGVVEAEATAVLIRIHSINLHSRMCENYGARYCAKVVEFINTQLTHMYDVCDSFKHHTEYWFQVYLVLQQLTGLTDRLTEKPLDFSNRYSVEKLDRPLLINWEGDMIGLDKHFSLIENAGEYFRADRTEGRCSALIKLVNNELYIGHATWYKYQSMLRIQKKYLFNYHEYESASAPRVPGLSIVMTSYPGCLYSLHEFYTINSGLLVTETTVDLFRWDCMRNATPKSVPTWIRALVANRLATDGGEWTAAIGYENSGTYNNQYMVVDFNKFESDRTLKRKGVLWVFEQAPKVVTRKDMTQELKKKTSFASFNMPLFKKTRDVVGYTAYVARETQYTFENHPRKLIFDRDHSKVDSIESMIKQMRYNDNQNDELSL